MKNNKWYETHPVPPDEFHGKPIFAPKVKSYGVGSWCPTLDGSGKAEAVVFHVNFENGMSVIIRLKSRAEVNRTIAMLMRHADDVWPESKEPAQ